MRNFVKFDKIEYSIKQKIAFGEHLATTADGEPKNINYLYDRKTNNRLVATYQKRS